MHVCLYMYVLHVYVSICMYFIQTYIYIHANTNQYCQYVHIRKYVQDMYQVQMYVFGSTYERILHRFFGYVRICTTWFTDAAEQIMLTAAEVNALYPSIQLERGMTALRWFMEQHTSFNQAGALRVDKQLR